MDFTAAYLNANMENDKIILMRLSKETSAIRLLVAVYRSYLRNDSTLLDSLPKAHYMAEWKVRNYGSIQFLILINDGFTSNAKDPCIFNKIVDGKKSFMNLQFVLNCRAISLHSNEAPVSGETKRTRHITACGVFVIACY